MKTSYMIKRTIPYYKKYVWIMLADLGCAATVALCDLVLPMLVRFVTNTAETNLAALSIALVLKIAIAYLLIRLVDAGANFYMAYVGHVMGTKIETNMRQDLFDKLQTLSFSYYSNHKVGQLMSRITSDLFDVTEFAHHCPEEIFIALLKITISFTLLCRINIPLTLIMFATLPLIFIFAKYYRNKMHDAFKERRHQVGEVNAQVEDSLLGIRVVKSFANEDIEKEKFADGNDLFYEAKRKSYFYMAGFHTTNRFFEGLLYLIVVFAGAIFLTKGKISAGDYIAYLLYCGTLLATLRTIIQFTEQFQQGMTGIERFLEIMDTDSDIQEKENATTLANVKGDIRFDNVSFKYDDGVENVFENINLHIPVGGNFALVGPSGGGKTTLCNLIPRFYDATCGTISIDNTDVKDVTLNSLRNSIGVVQQDVYLFSGTIEENIRYGKPNASREEIVEAAIKAGADEFIQSLPNGYDTYVGERGVKLSGGQKQRVSIARVFLKNPPILILDEATSALDNESERLVQKSLEDLAKGRTVLTIAHRLSTIKNADKIIVLTETGIAETGNHDELLAQGGIYADLYNMM